MTTIKRHDSTYFIENEWVDKKGIEQKATVRLEIDYINKKCSIKPAISEKFLFVNGKLAEWIAVANCIRNAAEFAQIELGETEGEDTVDLSCVPEMCTNLIGEPIPDCKTETSTDAPAGNLIPERVYYWADSPKESTKNEAINFFLNEYKPIENVAFYLIIVDCLTIRIISEADYTREYVYGQSMNVEVIAIKTF